MGKIYIGDLFSKKVTKRRPIWAKSLLWRLSILKGDPFGNTATQKLKKNRFGVPSGSGNLPMCDF